MAKHLHERRKITFREYGALLATRDMLKRGDLEFKPGCRYAEPGKHLFNMGTAGNVEGCGSIGCIGGTMALIMGESIDKYVRDHRDSPFELSGCSASLSALFYPPDGNSFMSWDWITPKIAIKAIDNWLRTGKPSWRRLKPKQA